jgi:hypothetical protein
MLLKSTRQILEWEGYDWRVELKRGRYSLCVPKDRKIRIGLLWYREGPERLAKNVLHEIAHIPEHTRWKIGDRIQWHSPEFKQEFARLLSKYLSWLTQELSRDWAGFAALAKNKQVWTEEEEHNFIER